MISKNFAATIEEVAQERNISTEQALEAFTMGLIAGCKKAHNVRTCRVDIDAKDDKTEISVYKQYFVLSPDYLDEDVDKDYTLITLSDAKEMNKRAKAGELLEVKVDPKDFNLFAARDFKQRFQEGLTTFQKENQYNVLKNLVDEMVLVKVIDVQENHYVIEIKGDATTLLPKKETLLNDKFHVGDRTKVYVTNVEMKPKEGIKSFVSRKHPNLIVRLLEDLVPEIKQGIIEVVGISRDPGDRSKIGVRSSDENVDPIGATVGESGSRIKEIVKSLSGEKIDLFRWSDNEKDLIANSLQPAKVIAVNVNTKEKKAVAIVADDQLSLAIGKLGQNVKLAVQATGYSIDIKSESIAAQEGIIY